MADTLCISCGVNFITPTRYKKHYKGCVKTSNVFTNNRKLISYTKFITLQKEHDIALEKIASFGLVSTNSHSNLEARFDALTN